MATKRRPLKKTNAEREEAIKKALEAVEKETEELTSEVDELEDEVEARDDEEDADIKEEEESTEVDDEREEKEEIEEEREEEIEDAREDKDEEEKEERLEEREEKEEKEQVEERVAREEKVEEVKEPEVTEEQEERKGSSFGPIEEEKSQNSWLWKFVYVVAFLVGVGGAILIYQITGGSLPTMPQQEVVQETPTPSPTEAPEVNVEDYPVTVQNGSGEAGVASAGQELLEGEGFEVADTGNADNYDYEETVISAGSEVPGEVIEKLKEVLGEEYEVAEDVEELDEENEILVIIGSSAKE